jgi:hypothetical protein
VNALRDLPTLLSSPELALMLSLDLCAVSVIVRTLELLDRRSAFAPQGCLAWQLSAELSAVSTPRWLSPLFGGSGVRAVLIARLAAACGILVPGLTVSVPCVVIVAVTSLLMNFRMPLGQDGSDQMNVVILLPASIAMMCNDQVAKSAALFFIAAQASLAYSTSGIAKLISRVWRSGDALSQVLSTSAYGNARASRMLRTRPAVAAVACWSVMLFETLFPLCLLAGPRGVLCVLAAGVVFHASCAAVMGLNCFFWSFVATYPAIAFTSTRWLNPTAP